jgi:hydroxymethylpyrimidine pyrophosphatase-like HAD family hydrolase
MLNKIIAFDLDDTLCSRPKNLEHLGPEKYNYCTPIQPTIDVLNKLYDQGNIIYIYTARGMGQFDGNVRKTYSELYEITLNSLKMWGIKHHGLIMGKLHYDLLIDDKCLNINDISDIENYLINCNKI